MATNKSQSPQPKAPTHKGSSSYSPAPNQRGPTTQVSAGGLNKVVANAEQGTGSGQR
jgi:hypothetical protein